MNIVNAKHEILEEKDALKKIEKIARLCYKSEDLITEGSDVKMVKGLLSRKHYAMLEHYDIAFSVSMNVYREIRDIVHKVYTALPDTSNKLHSYRSYLRFSSIHNYIISGNLRAWIETLTDISSYIAKAYVIHIIDDIFELTKGVVDLSHLNFLRIDVLDNMSTSLIEDWSKYKIEERMMHEIMTVYFECDRGITHELVRMRPCSFAQESTRYVNYNKGKYGNSISVIDPFFFKEDQEKYNIWMDACRYTEEAYMKLIQMGAKPQEARSVLPNSIKSGIFMTTNLSEWRHIFELRACDSTGPAHPQMSEIMRPLLREARDKYEFAFRDLVIPGEVIDPMDKN